MPKTKPLNGVWIIGDSNPERVRLFLLCRVFSGLSV